MTKNKKSDQDDDRIIRVVMKEGIPLHEKYVPTPMEMYEGSIHGFDKTWKYLTNKKHIVPAGGAIDVPH